jgi:hypothetical protein
MLETSLHHALTIPSPAARERVRVRVTTPTRATGRAALATIEHIDDAITKFTFFEKLKRTTTALITALARKTSEGVACRQTCR